MASIRSDAEGGLNEFLKEQKKLPGKAILTLAQFDHEYELLHDGVALEDVPKYSLVPRGTTALLDAIGRTINTVDARLQKVPEAYRPSKVIVVVVTDGAENSSKEFSREQVFSLIENQKKVRDWEFLFLAANQDAIGVAGSLGIQNATNFVATPQGARDMGVYTSRLVGSYRSGGGAAIRSRVTMNVSDSVVDGKLKDENENKTTEGSTTVSK